MRGEGVAADLRAIAAQDRRWAAEVVTEELRAADGSSGGGGGEGSGGEETDTDEEAEHEKAGFEELRKSAFRG